jgi:hypothetical protein
MDVLHLIKQLFIENNIKLTIKLSPPCGLRESHHSQFHTTQLTVFGQPVSDFLQVVRMLAGWLCLEHELVVLHNEEADGPGAEHSVEAVLHGVHHHGHAVLRVLLELGCHLAPFSHLGGLAFH